MLVLLDITGMSDLLDAKRVQALLRALPGVEQVRVRPSVSQAEVVVADEAPAALLSLTQCLRGAGYLAQASRVPSAVENPDYARYYHAPLGTSDSDWID